MYFTIALLLISFVSGCNLSYQKITSKPVIKVNDHFLTSKEFSTQIARQLKNYDALLAKDSLNIQRIKDDVTRSFIIQSLTEDWAIGQNISISDSDLEVEAKKLRANYPDDLSFRRALAKEDLSFSEWQNNLRYLLIEKAVLKKLSEKVTSPSEVELIQYYENQKNKFKRAESILVRQILVELESRAEFIKNEVKTKDFAETAKKFSIAPESKNGGLVGWIEKGSVDFFDPLFKSPLNVVQIIQSSFGYHVVKVEQKKSAGFLPFNEIKKVIESELLSQKNQAIYLSWLDGQLRSAKVYKDLELIRSLKVETKRR
ncbi:MAG: peptidylprolyl isomerase [Pseudobdellovibrionaceae bacterium]